MLIPSSRPLTFSSDAFQKHLGDQHDQTFHGGKGRSEAYRKLAIQRKKDMNAGRVKRAMPRDSKGRVICPEATGGYKAGIPEVVNIDKQGNFVDGELTKDSLTPESSLWHHLVPAEGGGYRVSDERAKLHRQIVEETTRGVPVSEDPTFFMLGGGPAAGKSTALRSGIAPGVPDPDSRQAVVVNADNVKSDLPEFERMRKGDDAGFYNAAAFAHEESSMVAKQIQSQAIKNKQDVILDGTGDSSPDKLGKKITEAEIGGYKVRGVYFTIPTAEAWERSKARSLKSSERRFVPKEVVYDTHRDVSNTFAVAAENKMFQGGIMLIDSSVKGAAKIIGQSDASGNFIVADQAGYDAFLEKGNE